MNNTKIPYEFKSDTFHSSLPACFDEYCLKLFNYQFEHSQIYHAFCTQLNRTPDKIAHLHDIPFLPIEFYKTSKVITGTGKPELTFQSSGTGGNRSKHFVLDGSIYKESIIRGFRHFYGDPFEYHFLALLPSYLEQRDASLIYMTDLLMKSGKSGAYYLDDHVSLYKVLNEHCEKEQKVILLGVTYALLDFAEKYTGDFSSFIVMETGGMKGRRKELVREEVHNRLKKAFNVSYIHSEYGMTELLSQSYSAADGYFYCPPWMRVLVRDHHDPLEVQREPGAGAINIIDLANTHSCAFIATDDVGRVFADGSFEITGRLDTSDLRGCNLMVSDY